MIRGLLVGLVGLQVTHLWFVDDTILFLPECKENFQHTLSLLQIFDVVSGLHINLSKCGLADINV